MSRTFLIDNTRIDGKIYSADGHCGICKMNVMSSSFYKDSHGMPYYFKILKNSLPGHEISAIMFCGPIHSNDWAHLHDYKDSNGKK